MVDRARNLSTMQKIGLGLTALLTTFCVLCCGCVGLIALLPADENEIVAAEVSSESAEARTEPESVLRESAPEPDNTPPTPTTTTTTIPSTLTDTPVPTNTPHPTNTARPAPTFTDEPETGQTTLVSGTEVTGESATEDFLAAGDFAAVTRIIDGDTIEVDINGQTYRVRYIGMDTPERGDPYFDEATAANRQLVEGQTIIMVKDVSETDRYGRLLRYIYLPDGTFVNAELVKQGYALVATFPPDVRHQGLFVQLQQEAREAGSGLWGQAVATLPPAASQTPQPTNPPLPTNTPLPVPTTAASPQPTNTPEPAPTAVPIPPTEPPSANCDPSYPTVCIPPPPPDLDCGQIPHRNFTVLEPDPHGFDRDNDGIGCES